jgi:hypothetical protein
VPEFGVNTNCFGVPSSSPNTLLAAMPARRFRFQVAMIDSDFGNVGGTECPVPSCRSGTVNLARAKGPQATARGAKSHPPRGEMRGWRAADT